MAHDPVLLNKIETMMTVMAAVESPKHVAAAYQKEVEDLDTANWPDTFYAGLAWRAAFGVLKKVGGFTRYKIVELIGEDPMPMTDEFWQKN